MKVGDRGKTAKQPGERQSMSQKPHDTSDLKKSGDVPFDDGWIAGKSDAELADLIAHLAQKLRARLARETQKIDLGSVSRDFDADPRATVEEFVRLPVASMKSPAESAATTWRVVMIGPAPDHKPLGLEIHDEVTLGRWSAGVRPELDLTEYDAEKLGVSRRHALLRPTQDSLLLADLGSTNGTQCNGVKLGANRPKALSDGDIVVFGGLHFMIRIVSAPGKPDR